MLARIWDSDLAYSFRQTPTAVAAAIIALILVIGALCARRGAGPERNNLTILNGQRSRLGKG